MALRLCLRKYSCFPFFLINSDFCHNYLHTLYMFMCLQQTCALCDYVLFLLLLQDQYISLQEVKISIVIAGFYIHFSFLKSWLYSLANQCSYQNSISNYGLMKRAAKNIVVIYRVMHTEHDEYTLYDNESLG